MPRLRLTTPNIYFFTTLMNTKLRIHLRSETTFVFCQPQTQRILNNDIVKVLGLASSPQLQGRRNSWRARCYVPEQVHASSFWLTAEDWWVGRTNPICFHLHSLLTPSTHSQGYHVVTIYHVLQCLHCNCLIYCLVLQCKWHKVF